MDAITIREQPTPDYELRFQPIAAHEPMYVFPCDACGHVDLDNLSARTRNNYFFARAFVGRQYLWPLIQPV